MLHYRNIDNPTQVFAFDTEEQRQRHTPAGVNLVLMTPEEVQAHVNPPPTPEQIQAAYDAFLEEVRELREKAINRLMGISVRAERASMPDIAAACDVATESLLNITADLPAELQAAQIAVVTRWRAAAETLALTAPTAVSAFRGLDLS